MYLKELELQHFKSFFEKQKVPFKSNFIVITGPNGSGKSNILDAVRWVFGEQRTKLLRAEKSEEVIFGGNKFLSFSKYTQVSVVLMLPQGDNFFQEVTISRRLERDGESEYFLNDKTVRLRDLQLFLSTYGLGRHNFVFIGQGELETLILNKEELKRFIEDIAGISGYQEKVKETQFKLEIIEAKWRELEDKRLALLENLEILKKEAKDAEHYLSLSKELESVRESLIFYQWQRIEKTFESYNREIWEKEKKIEKLKNEFAFINDNLIKLQEELRKIELETNDYQKEWGKIKALLMEMRLKIEIENQKIISTSDKKERAEEEITNLKKELEYIDKELRDLKDNKEKTELFNLERELKEIEKELREKEILKYKYEQKLSSFTEYLSLDKEFLENKLISLENSISRVKRVLEKLKIKKELLENYFAKTHEDLKAKETIIRSKERYLEELNFEFQKERRILRDLEEALLDNYPKGVREVLSLKDEEVFGIIADIIQVEKKYLNAIYCILGNSLFDIIVRDEYSAKRLIEYLREKNLGWATFRPLNFYNREHKQKNISYGLWAINVIRFQPQYEGLIYNILGNVLIFEDFESALKRSYLLKEGWRLVTLKGEVFLGNGTISGGIRLNIQNTLNINKMKIEKEEKIKQLTQNMSFLEEDLLNLRNHLKELLKRKEKIKTLLTKIEEKIEKGLNNLKEYNKNMENLMSFLREGEESIRILDLLKREILFLEETLEIKRKRYEEIMGEYIFLDKKRSFLKERKEVLEKRLNDLKILEENLRRDLEKLINERDYLEKKEVQEKEQEEGLREKINKREKDIKILKEEEKILKEKWQKLREEIIMEETILKQLNKRKDEMEKEYLEKFNKKPSLKIDLPESKLKSKEKEVLREIEEIGPINFLAKEKLLEEGRKYKELSEELEDIYGSISSLRKIIKDTRREAERRFLDAYEKLRYISNKNWKLFFPHGEFDLILTNLEDSLNSEVSIKITSDRKNYKSLLMLSGGEKSVSALSLLLAGIEIAPVNFCFWDEIDSALDNHNAEILGEKIKDLSKKIQFILISHNPTLMRFSEILYGITINEKGSSQIIVYNLEKEVSFK